MPNLDLCLAPTADKGSNCLWLIPIKLRQWITQVGLYLVWWNALASVMREAFWLGCPINTYFLDWPTAAMYQRSSRGSYKMSGTRVPGNTLKTPFSVPMYLSNVGEFRNFLTLLSCTDHIDQSYGFYFHFIKLTLNCFHFKHTIFCPQLVVFFKRFINNVVGFWPGNCTILSP